MTTPSTETLETPTTGAVSVLGLLAALWGIGGVVFLLTHAVVRLAPRAVEAIRMDLGALEWAALLGCVAFLAYSEGYKAFHKAFSPRVVARAAHLASRPVWWHVFLAPAFCMGFFHATRKRVIVSWILAVGIVGLIVLVQQMSMPWRGFVDAGVVVALSWGVLSILYFAVKATLGQALPVPPDLPPPA